jgi:hypothetical protein
VGFALSLNKDKEEVARTLRDLDFHSTLGGVWRGGGVGRNYVGFEGWIPVRLGPSLDGGREEGVAEPEGRRNESISGRWIHKSERKNMHVDCNSRCKNSIENTGCTIAKC